MDRSYTLGVVITAMAEQRRQLPSGSRVVPKLTERELRSKSRLEIEVASPRADGSHQLEVHKVSGAVASFLQWRRACGPNSWAWRVRTSPWAANVDSCASTRRRRAASRPAWRRWWRPRRGRTPHGPASEQTLLYKRKQSELCSLSVSALYIHLSMLDARRRRSRCVSPQQAMGVRVPTTHSEI